MTMAKHSSSKQKGLGNASRVAFKRWIFLRPRLSLLMITTFVSLILIIYLQPAATRLSSKLRHTAAIATVPECPSSPWKENESLHGYCQGPAFKSFPSSFKLNPEPKSATECATTCCDDPKCITFQYRSDTGCYQGDDVRLGPENDVISTWCDDSPPVIWRGQYLVPRVEDENGREKVYTDLEKFEFRKKSCDLKSWSPDDRQGECFGLGGKREAASGSDEECMKACCEDPDCGAWQWSKNSGCFYGKSMFGCLSGSSEAYIGRRKFQAGRTYTDGSGKPYQQVLSK